jgi:hypothetical protein
MEGRSTFPPYSFVPGGPWPHPVSSPKGHSAGRPPHKSEPIVDGRWQESTDYLRGVELFNGGYYWESHEVWESLWHAHGRRGPTADLLKGLIKLAAAGVKVREGQPSGVTTHARRAAALMEAIRAEVGETWLGLRLSDWADIAQGVADHPPHDPGEPGAAVSRVFDFRIEPR